MSSENYSVMKISEKIHCLKINFTITISPEKKISRYVNCIIIFGEKITLIDSGVKESINIIFDYLEKNGRQSSEIEMLILSHAHPDHIGSAAEIKELTHCKVMAHLGDRNWIENIKLQNSERPVPGFFNLVDRSTIIDNFLEDGEYIKCDEEVNIKIIHAPGHSKGSINVFFQEDKILFTADSIPVKNDIPNYDNFRDLVQSLDFIRTYENYNTLLTSWSEPLFTKKEIDKFLEDGYEYLKLLDQTVKQNYIGEESETLEFCKKVISQLNLSPVFVMPIVDKAFRSHLI